MIHLVALVVGEGTAREPRLGVALFLGCIRAQAQEIAEQEPQGGSTKVRLAVAVVAATAAAREESQVLAAFKCSNS